MLYIELYHFKLIKSMKPLSASPSFSDTRKALLPDSFLYSGELIWNDWAFFTALVDGNKIGVLYYLADE